MYVRQLKCFAFVLGNPVIRWGAQPSRENMLDWQVHYCDDGSDDLIDESSSEEVEGDEATFECENPQDAAPAQLPNEWTWDMPFKDRMG